MARETTESIEKWALETFGPATSLSGIAARANQEMAELLTLANGYASYSDIAAECADVVIVLTRICAMCNADLWEQVEKKMAVNRKREWTLDGHGHGQHVPEPTQ